METIHEIKEKLQAAEEQMLPDLLDKYGQDERAGVRSACERARKKVAALHKEQERVHAMHVFEQEQCAKIYGGPALVICGIDEAGRGPLAGPVSAGAVILPPDHDLLYINDSKKLSAAMREKLYDQIEREAISYSVQMVSPERIDEINILQATYEAMRKAVAALNPTPEVLINDAVRIPSLPIPQVPVIKGDAKCLSIAAASIMAKVSRDRLMIAYDEMYPEYGFAHNKGYGSSDHIEALKKYGPCPIHRRSFIGNFVG